MSFGINERIDVRSPYIPTGLRPSVSPPGLIPTLTFVIQLPEFPTLPLLSSPHLHRVPVVLPAQNPLVLAIGPLFFSIGELVPFTRVEINYL